MSTQPPTPDNRNEANQSLPPAEITQPTNTPISGPATASHLQQVEQQMSSFERATIRWARAAVILSGLAAAFVCLQWWEMHSGGQDTHDLAVAAKKQADKADAISISIGQAVDQLTASAVAAGKQANAAQESVRAIQRQMRLDHRASIAVKVAGPESRPFNLGAPIVIPLDVSNIGRSTATGIQGTVVTYLLDITVDLANPPEAWRGNLEFKVLFPGDRQAIPSEMRNADKTPVFLTDEIIERINTGKAILLTFGRVDYGDLFGKRWTQFCFLTGPPPTKGFTTSEKKCNDYNKTDQEH